MVTGSTVLSMTSDAIADAWTQVHFISGNRICHAGDPSQQVTLPAASPLAAASITANRFVWFQIGECPAHSVAATSPWPAGDPALH
jgi:hypothetical protein